MTIRAVFTRLVVLLIASIARQVDSALPPGYDEELYCSVGRCLRSRASVHPGMVGARKTFHECAPVDGGPESFEPESHPVGWGSKLGEEARTELLTSGYHQSRCADDEIIEASAASRLEEEEELLEHEEYEGRSNTEACVRPGGSKPAVHAAFYLWYGNPEVDGRWIHWNHKVLPHWEPNEDAKHDKFDWRPPHEPHSTFMPERGVYSSRDNATLVAQFLELASAGVDSAMCSWWGRKDWAGKRDDADSGANTDELIPSVLEAALKANVFVSFHIEPYGGRTPDTFLDDLRYIHDSYGKHPALWREAPSGLPLFWLYDVSAQHSKKDVGEWRRVLDSVRGTELDGVFLCLWIGGHGMNDASFVQEGGFDGAYTYFAAEGFTPGSNPKSWPSAVRTLKSMGKLFVPAVGPGYDDTRVRPWNKHNIRDRKNGAYYDRMWEAAVGSNPHAVSVTSYNEWGEGTQIEPAVRYTSPSGIRYHDYYPEEPNGYLQKTQGWSNRFKEESCGA